MLPEYFPDSVGEQVIGKWVKELARHNGAICVSQTVAHQLEQWINDNGIVTNSRFRYDWFHHGSDIGSSVPTRGLPDNVENQIGRAAWRERGWRTDENMVDGVVDTKN